MRISVIVPTYQRGPLALSCVQALARQRYAATFEVVVVVDGSTDGTVNLLRTLAPTFPLRVLEQPNRGAAAARNRGAKAAGGEILLFLDDDMEADPDLLAEHDASHRSGAEVVLGHMPLHPDSPAGFLTRAVARSADRRLRRLSAREAVLTLHDLLTGQLSVRSERFRELGGFDTRFTQGELFGDEDLDFGVRLLRRGARMVFNPHAVSFQRYVVTPRQHLVQWRRTGRADVLFARKHPDRARALFQLHHVDAPHVRRRVRPIARVRWLGPVVTAAVRRLALGLVARRPNDSRAERLFFRARDLEYWTGVYEAGGVPRPRVLHVLAYHAVEDRKDPSASGRYVVRPAMLARQLRTLRRLRYTFVHPVEVVAFLRGVGGLPRRPILLTFDDGYEELLTRVLPILRAFRAPAAVFAVTGLLGRTNVWDAKRGAPERRLLDLDGLRRLAAEGFIVGAHSRSHRVLPALGDVELHDELVGSVEDLARAGFEGPRLFAYPYGDYDARVEAVAAEAGIELAFSADPGHAPPGTPPLRIPRIEVTARDGIGRLLWKLATIRRTPGTAAAGSTVDAAADGADGGRSSA